MANIKLKFKKVELGTKTLEDFCKEKVNEKSKSIRNKGLGAYDSYIEAFEDLFHNKYCILNGICVEITEKIEDEGFSLLKDNGDGTFEYAISYHDGANHWTDFLKEEICK